MDVSQYLEIFIDETKEHLQSLNQQLLILEKEPENVDTINEIFRAAHSLKGMAGTMGFKRMQKLTHNMENVLSEIRTGKMRVSATLVDVLFRCLDALEEYLSSIQSSGDEGEQEHEGIISQLDEFLQTGGEILQEVKQTKKSKKENVNQPSTEQKFAEFEAHAIDEAIAKNMNIFSIDVEIEESCILKSARAFLVFKHLEEHGEIIKSEPSVQDIEDEKFDLHFNICIITNDSYETIEKIIKNVSEIKSVTGKPLSHIKQENIVDATVQMDDFVVEEVTASKSKTIENAKDKGKPQESKQSNGGKPVVSRTVRIDIEKLDVLMNLVSELIIAKNGLVSASSDEEHSTNQIFNEQIEYLERVTTNLHESVMKVRMMPIETVTNKFPRMIRDISKKLDKKMELYISGEETELDRTVIDEIGDPLMHLLRNSADHGLESRSIRKERGKPETGSVFLTAYQDGNNVVIEVRDDGNGIDVEAVRQKAIERNVVNEEQSKALSDKEVVDLLFLPSFSTAASVSDISGRGVGLDVVKTKIEALGGDVSVKTKLGEGTTFFVRLPLTLAIIQALMVEIGEEKYAISLGAIQTIEDIEESEIKYVQMKEVIHLRGNVIPLVRLNQILDIESNESETGSLTVVIVKKGTELAGLVVNNLIGQQEIVIKSLGKYINNQNKIIGGATILGNGDVALILDVNTLV